VFSGKDIALVREVYSKFLHEDCDCLEDVRSAQSLFTVEYMQREMQLKAGICGKIVKSLEVKSSRQPQQPPVIASSVASSAGQYQFRDLPIVIDAAPSPLFPGILRGHYRNPYSHEDIAVVLKLDNKGGGNSALPCRDLQAESDILAALKDSKYVVDLLEYNAVSSPNYLVLKYHGNTLESFMHSGNLPLRKILASELARAVHAVHDKGFMHGDLKPANIVVALHEGGMFELKLIDFDSARIIGTSKCTLKPVNILSLELFFHYFMCSCMASLMILFRCTL
jgi:serine/threonine protein kinase